MMKLWGKPFTVRRDELAGPGANAQAKGNCARALKAELQAELEVDDGND